VTQARREQIRTRARAFLALAAALLVEVPSSARASDADDEAAATELFNAGRDLMKAGQYETACPKLAESARLKPTVGALAKLAECEEHQKRLVSAYARWQQALNLARATGDDRAEDVQRELGRLDGVVPKLRITAAAALPAGTKIGVDDVELGVGGLGVRLPLEPGRHAVLVAAPSKKPWSASVDTAADGATTLVTIPALEDAPTSAATLPVLVSANGRSPGDQGGSGMWRTVGLIVAGAGVGAVAAGGALGIDAMRRRDEARCPGNVCADADSASTLRGAKTSADWATALFVGGAVLVAGGLTAWWFSGDGPRPHSGLVVTPAGIAVAY
jgi:hypothetical protein